MAEPQKRGDVIVFSPDRGVRERLDIALRDERYRVVLTATAAEADLAARSASAEMAVIDSQAGQTLDHMARLRKLNPALGFLLAIGADETILAVEAARAGAYDFFIRPIDDAKSAFRLRVALEKHSRALEERAYTVALEERLNNRTEEVMASRDRIKTQFINTIRALEKALQAKNVYTEGHSRRVAEKSVEIARAMKVPREQIRHIELGALFHDIGKIGIRDDVLNKPGRLTESEYEHMKLHPIVAEQILSPIQELRPIVDIVKHEHERWDGKGYPSGLKGTQIPLGSRLIAITDAWDSMVYDRVYRKALTHEVALVEIEKHAGTQFDPECVRVFCELERAKLQSTPQSTPKVAAPAP
jgi:HD-GYP domain-containing protein (c-di-GMP phosphodiesterase class II)